MNKDRITLALLTAFFRYMPNLLAATTTPERAAAEASAFLQINADIKDSAAFFLSGDFDPDPAMSPAKQFALIEYLVALANSEPQRSPACYRVADKLGPEWVVMFVRGLNDKACGYAFMRKL